VKAVASYFKKRIDIAQASAPELHMPVAKPRMTDVEFAALEIDGSAW